MKLRLISDLHAEFGFDEALLNSQDADVLVIAGDLHVGAANTFNLLKRFAESVKDVLYVPGNHEYYRNDFYDVNSKLENWCADTNIHFLNASTVYYDEARGRIGEQGIKIVGASLWTNFRNNDLAMLAAKSNINDFRMITYDNQYFSPKHARNLFEQHWQYIKQQKPDVVITHFLPVVEAIAKQYQGPDLLNYYFANDLVNDIPANTKLWLFGHTHDNVDLTLAHTRFIANPYGYGKNKDYNEQLITI